MTTSLVKISELGALTTPALADVIPIVHSGVTDKITIGNLRGGIVNIKDYGAVGDGVTDDTAAIQAAINIGGSVFFPDPAVSYKVTSQLTASPILPIRILGESEDKTIIDWQGGNNAVVLFIDSSYAAALNGVEVENLYIKTSTGATGITGIEIGSTISESNRNQVWLRSIFFATLAVGVKFTGGLVHLKVERSYFSTCGIGIQAVGPTEFLDIEQNFFIPNAASSYSVDTSQINELVIRSNTFGVEYNQANNIQVNNGKRVIIESNAFAASHDTGNIKYILVGATTLVQQVEIRNNEFNFPSANGTGIYLNLVDGVIIANNLFTGGAIGITLTANALGVNVFPQVWVATEPTTRVENNSTSPISMYEEGTWTPTRNGFTESGGGTITNTGRYTKIGRLVFISAVLTCSGGAVLTSVANTSYLSGLPYAAAKNVPAYAYCHQTSLGGVGYCSTIYLGTPSWTGSANQTFSVAATFEV